MPNGTPAVTPPQTQSVPAQPSVQQPSTLQSSPQQPNVNVVGKRILAALIDVTIWGILFAIASILFGTKEVLDTTTTTTNQAGQVVGYQEGFTFNYNLTGLPLLVFALAEFSYFVFLEWLAGATIGKMLLGLKVTNENGDKITLSKSLIRNVLRIVDAFPYVIPYIVGLIVLSTNDKKQRLGDKAAHTLVSKP